jgi:rhodanese-related sulfurtransferase
MRVPFRCVDVDEFDRLRARGALVLDARDARAFAAARIDGSAPLSSATLSTLIAETPRSRPIAIYCYHGHASRDYAAIFSDFGFTDVASLDGGFEAWRVIHPDPSTVGAASERG